MKTQSLASFLLTLAISTPALSQTLDWLPAEFHDSVAENLTKRIQKTGLLEGKTDEEVLKGSRQMIAGIQKALNKLGTKGVFEATTSLRTIRTLRLTRDSPRPYRFSGPTCRSPS